MSKITHDVRQDYDKYYKTVILNLIGVRWWV